MILVPVQEAAAIIWITVFFAWRADGIENIENGHTQESAGQEFFGEVACDHSKDCNRSQPINVSTVGKLVCQRSHDRMYERATYT